MIFNTRHWTAYLFYAYLAVLVWVPMPLASRPLWAASFFNIGVSVLSMVALIGCYRTGHPLPEALRRAGWVFLVWGVYLGWLLYQAWAGYSINVFHSRQQFWLSLSYVQLFALTLFLVDTRDRVKLLFYVLVGSGLFQALYGSLMAMSGVDKIWWIEKVQHRGMATGTFRNRNQLANYLVMCIALGSGLLLASQRSRGFGSWRDVARRLLDWLLSGAGWLRLLLVALVIGVVLTHSRMGNMSLFVSLTVVGVIWLLRSQLSWKRSVALLGSLLLVDTLIVGSWFGLDKVVERLQETEARHFTQWVGANAEPDDDALDAAPAVSAAAAPATVPTTTPAPAPAVTTTTAAENPPTTPMSSPVAAAPVNNATVTSAKPVKRQRDNELRDEAFPQLLQMAQDHWQTGIGLGNFRTGFTAYSRLNAMGIYNEAHCDYLQFVIETGAIGTGSLAVIVLYCFGSAVKALWTRRSHLIQGAGFATTMAMTASLMHAWVDFNFQSPATTSLFIVVMAVAVLVNGLPSGHAQMKQANRVRREPFSLTGESL